MKTKMIVIVHVINIHMSDLLNGTSLEKQFCESIKNGTVVVSCGVKAGGKSCFMLAMLRACIEANAFEQYILVFPSLYVEQHDSYAWCLKQKSFHIYTGYHNKILEKLYIQNRDIKKQKKTLVVIDDATTFAKELRLATNENLIALVSQARHLKVTLWLLLHSLLNIISPVLRENIGFLIIYNVTNAKLLHDIWEEFLSVQCSYQEFLLWYRELTKVKYSSFMLKTSAPVALDANSGNWAMTVRFREMNQIDCNKKQFKEKTNINKITQIKTNGDKK